MTVLEELVVVYVVERVPEGVGLCGETESWKETRCDYRIFILGTYGPLGIYFGVYMWLLMAHPVLTLGFL